VLLIVRSESEVVPMQALARDADAAVRQADGRWWARRLGWSALCGRGEAVEFGGAEGGVDLGRLRPRSSLSRGSVAPDSLRG
jgi:hypothetical protein